MATPVQARVIANELEPSQQGSLPPPPDRRISAESAPTLLHRYWFSMGRKGVPTTYKAYLRMEGPTRTKMPLLLWPPCLMRAVRG
jgi:hypothetical protein